MEMFHWVVGHGYVLACHAFGGLVPVSKLTRSLKPFEQRCKKWREETVALQFESFTKRSAASRRSMRREAACQSQ